MLTSRIFGITIYYYSFQGTLNQMKQNQWFNMLKMFSTTARIPYHKLSSHLSIWLIVLLSLKGAQITSILQKAWIQVMKILPLSTTFRYISMNLEKEKVRRFCDVHCFSCLLFSYLYILDPMQNLRPLDFLLHSIWPFSIFCLLHSHILKFHLF